MYSKGRHEGTVHLKSIYSVGRFCHSKFRLFDTRLPSALMPPFGPSLTVIPLVCLLCSHNDILFPPVLPKRIPLFDCPRTHWHLPFVPLQPNAQTRILKGQACNFFSRRGPAVTTSGWSGIMHRWRTGQWPDLVVAIAGSGCANGG